MTNLRRRDNTSITRAYDAVGRVSAKGGAVSETFAYDNLGNVTSNTRSSMTSSFTYNSLGWLLSEASALGSVAYSYNAVGRRRSSLTWPDSFSVAYAYDNAGALTAISQGGSAIASFGYDDAGRRATVTRPNGATTSYVYDGVSRLTGLTQDLAPTGADLVATFAYNPASQLKSRAVGNLLYEATPAAASLSYGVNGLNQVTTSGGLSVTYSARGNTTSDGVNSYTYDAENRLTGLVGGSSLTYDAQGRLYEITDGASTTRMLYDGVNLIAEYDGSGNVLRRYVHGVGTDEPLVWYEGGTANANRRWLIANQQGSVIAVTDNTGAAIATNTYDEYGVPGGSNLGRFQYTGQQWISELGLYHYKARAYSPALGRFMQTDPVGYDDGMNWYAYVDDDPINRNDPTGLFTAELRYNCIYVNGDKVCRAHHAYFLITDTDGTQTVYRGGPTPMPLLHRLYKGFGNILAVKERPESSKDYNAPYEIAVVLRNDNEPAADTIAKLDRYVEGVNLAGFKYNPLAANSNSVAHDAGEIASGVRVKPPVNAPAAETDLRGVAEEAMRKKEEAMRKKEEEMRRRRRLR